jgi:hypothetical protein
MGLGEGSAFTPHCHLLSACVGIACTMAVISIAKSGTRRKDSAALSKRARRPALLVSVEAEGNNT